MLAALQNPPLIDENSPLREAVADAQLLIAHAASHGIDLAPELVRSLVAAKELLTLDLADPATFERQSTFWDARNQLSKAVQPVTIASLKASTQTGPMVLYRSLFRALSRSARTGQPISPAERSVLWFRFLASLALFSLLTVQVYWVVGARVLSETGEILNQVKVSQLALKTLDIDDPKSQAIEAEGLALDKEMSIRYDILEGWNTVWAVPLQLFGLEIAPPVASPQYQDLQRARLTGEFVSQSIERYLLPLLYGWLGACLYVLRTLAREIKNLSYTAEQDMLYRLRVYMGTLAGLIVVWFMPIAQVDPNIKSLSVFAVALLVGYSIDLLFALLDRIINAFTAEKSA
ncbi:MAG: hypothetical protein WAV95_04560 [Azonexus sp.]